MPITSGANSTTNDQFAPATRPGASIWRDRIAPSLLAFALGAALIYGAGFASRVELHNAAHDGRHSAGFPCH